MSEIYGLVEDLDRCVGCHSCIIACSRETGEKVIAVREVGPRTVEGELTSDFLLTTSHDCPLCEEFWEEGLDPACISVCPTDALAVCDSRKLLKKLQDPRNQVIQITEGDKREDS